MLCPRPWLAAHSWAGAGSRACAREGAGACPAGTSPGSVSSPSSSPVFSSEHIPLGMTGVGAGVGGLGVNEVPAATEKTEPPNCGAEGGPEAQRKGWSGACEAGRGQVAIGQPPR